VDEIAFVTMERKVYTSEENYLRTEHKDLTWAFDAMAEMPKAATEAVVKARAEMKAACMSKAFEIAKRRDAGRGIDVVIDANGAVG
jgi:hypothetical protein